TNPITIQTIDPSASAIISSLTAPLDSSYLSSIASSLASVRSDRTIYSAPSPTVVTTAPINETAGVTGSVATMQTSPVVVTTTPINATAGVTGGVMTIQTTPASAIPSGASSGAATTPMRSSGGAAEDARGDSSTSSGPEMVSTAMAAPSNAVGGLAALAGVLGVAAAAL
ncbi:hypothetical protein LTS18_006386, partial [Coniosporium uncinatum]